MTLKLETRVEARELPIYALVARARRRPGRTRAAVVDRRLRRCVGVAERAGGQ